MGVAAVVDGGGGAVGKVKELVDHIGTRLLGPSGPKTSTALNGDEELVPTAGVCLRLGTEMKETKVKLGLIKQVNVLKTVFI